MLPLLIYQRSQINIIFFVSIELYLVIYFIHFSSVISDEKIYKNPDYIIKDNQLVPIQGNVTKDNNLTTKDDNLIANDENDNAVDGEKYLKSIVEGKKPTDKPEYLLFTAPFKICKGGCNESNFVMSFPIYLGIKKSAPIYSKIYSRDVNLYTSGDKMPFRKSTTKRPFTLCPVYSEEIAHRPILKPECRSVVRVSKVIFRDSLEFKQHKEIAIDKPNPLGRNSPTKPYDFDQILRSRNKIWRPLSKLNK